MSSQQTSVTEDKGDWGKMRELQHVVLLYLSANGATQWDKLYSHFDQGETGKIGPALRYLAQWGHIVVDDGDIVKISVLGVARLNSGPPLGA